MGTYRGIVRDLLTSVANFWPSTGALDRFCTFEARYTGKDPRDPYRGDWVHLYIALYS